MFLPMCVRLAICQQPSRTTQKVVHAAMLLVKYFSRGRDENSNNVAQSTLHTVTSLDKHWKMHDIVFNYRADFAERAKGL